MDWEKIHQEIIAAVDSGDSDTRERAKEKIAYIEACCKELSKLLNERLLAEPRAAPGPSPLPASFPGRLPG